MKNTITNNIKLTLIAILLLGFNKLHAQAPTISSFYPTSGSIGALITIIGTNLSNPTALNIGGVAALKISAKTDTLVAMVMPGAATGVIYIANANGNTTSTTNFTKIASTAPANQQGNKIVGTANSFQGASLDLSADGNTAIVGGWGDNNNMGAAWVYTRDGNKWTQQGSKLVGTDAISQGNQGCSVSISADGNTAIVGGWGDNNDTGAAWVYTRRGSNWIQQGGKLVGTGASGVGFGSGIFQGQSVSLSADGNTAIIGGYGDNYETGAAWVFTRSGNTWTQQGSKLVGIGAIGHSNQGCSVSLSADGNTAILGGVADNNNVGAAWIFTRRGNTWSQQGNKLVGTGAIGSNIFQGSSVSLSSDGNTAIMGGNNDNDGIGAAWIFTRSSSTWTQQGGKLVGTGAIGQSLQGWSVSLSADGNTAIVGGNYDNNQIGAAWIYTCNGGTWTQEGSKLLGTGANGQSRQGASVALSADGKTAMVGGEYDDWGNGSGAIWTYISSPASSIDEIKNTSLSIYPNPSNGIVTINSNQDIAHINLYDNKGKAVLNQEYTNKLNQTEIDLSALNNGIYFIAIQSSNGEISTSKIVLAK